MNAVVFLSCEAVLMRGRALCVYVGTLCLLIGCVCNTKLTEFLKSMRSMRWGFFSIIAGPCKRYAVTPTRISGHNCLPGPHVQVCVCMCVHDGYMNVFVCVSMYVHLYVMNIRTIFRAIYFCMTCTREVCAVLIKKRKCSGKGGFGLRM
jgi:hypothetical protein